MITCFSFRLSTFYLLLFVVTHDAFLFLSAAIQGLKERNGSSRQAIVKFIMANYKVGSDQKGINTRVKLALKHGVQKGGLKQVKGKGASGSFKAVAAEKKPKVKKAAAKSPKKPAAKKAKSPKKAAAAKKPKAAAAKKPKTPKKAAAAKKPKTPKKAAAAKKPKAEKKPKAAKTPKKAPVKKVAKKSPVKKAAPKKAAAKK